MRTKPTFRSGLTATRIAFAASRPLASITLATALFGVFGGLMTAFLLSACASAILDRQVVSAATWALSAVVINGLALTAGHTTLTVQTRLMDAVTADIDVDFIRAITETRTTERFDSRKMQEDLLTVTRERPLVAVAYVAVVRSVAALAFLAASSAAVLSRSPWLLVLVVAGAPGVALDRLARTSRNRAIRESATDGYFVSHVNRLCTNLEPVKEIRVHRMGERLIALRESHSRQARKRLRRAELLILGGQSLAALVVVGSFAIALLGVLHGRRLTAADVPTVVLVVSLASQLVAQVQGAATALSGLTRVLDALNRHLSLLEGLRSDIDPSPEVTHVPRHISFQNVQFRYPDSQAEAVTVESLGMEPGQVVALVGPNGAGKTTFAKLATGLYRPTNGLVAFGDHSVVSYRGDDWFPWTSVAYHDPFHFEGSIREYVSGGDSTLSDADLIQALTTAELDRELQALDQHLGRIVARGHEPSGGQWQRLSFARALARKTAVVVCLDEATANLDAFAEEFLITRYMASLRERAGQGEGATCLIVTHRLGVARRCDRIIVLDHGQVVEHGTHDELIRNGARYEEMYRLQAASYND